MLPFLPATLQRELQTLAHRYGEPRIRREALEEFGQALVTRRFLAAVTYRCDATPPKFYTFAFLLDGSAEPPRAHHRVPFDPG